jgi:hypothetical protein
MDNEIVLGIGFPKTATSYLYEALASHPEICFSARKETRFFEKHADEILNAETTASTRPARIEDFESLWRDFNPLCHRIRAEWTVSYIAKTKSLRAIKHFFRNSADPIFLLGIRDPIESVLSNYMYMALIREDSDAFKKSQLECMIQRPDIYLDPYDYHQHFKNFRTIFPQAKILLLPQRTIRSNPSDFFLELFRNLQLSPWTGWSSIPQLNVSNPYRSHLIHRISKWVAVRLYGDEQTRRFYRTPPTNSEIPALLRLSIRLNQDQGAYAWAPEAEELARKRLNDSAARFIDLTWNDPNCIYVGPISSPSEIW